MKPLPLLCLGMFLMKLHRFVLHYAAINLLFSGILLSGESDKPSSVLAIEKLGGLALPMPGGGWEVGFHLRGRESFEDEGLKALKNLGEIVSLNLRDTKITGKGLVHLQGLVSLRRLHLERTSIDNSGLKNLSKLKNLEYLNLYQTQVSDDGLRHLSDLKKLKKLFLWDTKVSDEGVRELKKSLPQLFVSRGLNLEKLAADAPKPSPPKPRASMKWLSSSGTESPPTKSTPGSPIQVTFLNKSKQPVKLVWMDYGGGQKLYGEISAGGSREQNTYSDAVWLITDLNDKPLGHFVTGQEDANGVIPAN